MTVMEATSTVGGAPPHLQSPASLGTTLVSRQPVGDSLAFKCFDEVRNLQAGWNGRSARAVSPVAINRAAVLLATFWSAAAALPDNATRGFALVPQVFARPAGGVQFEWHAGNAHLEIAVEPDGEAFIAAESSESGIDCDVDLDPKWPGRLPEPAVTVLGEIFARVWNARSPVR